MLRLISFTLLVSVFIEGAALAQTTTPTAKPRSTTKRVVWTIVGAGAGFGAGVFLGLNKFDDAVNSDRKVWISAIVGAAAGGLAGGLLSADRKREPPVGGRREPSSAALWYHAPRTLADVANVERLWTLSAVRDSEGR